MVKFLAVGEACKAMFRPAPGFKGTAFDSSVVSTEATSISASAVSTEGVVCGSYVT